MNPLTPYLVWIKLGAVAILAAFLAFFAYKVTSWRNDSLALDATKAEMVALREAQAQSIKASEGYQRELEDIRNRPVPSTPVRLCVKRPAVPAAGSGPGSAVPAPGMVSGGDGADYQEGPDIAADLRALARRADEVSAQGRATQSLHLPVK
jgi:type II secretory pathway pseudopilin PulG